MIPLADENPSGKKPYVVYALIAVNVFLYAIDYLGTQVYRGIPISGLWNYSMVPAAVITNTPVPVQIRYGPYLVTIPHAGLDPQWLTIFTSMFMHGSFLHIASNMLYLWIFGNNIEDALGHIRFLLFYLACGVFAALAHIFSNPASQVPTVGASGAIAGVLGAYFYLYPANRVTTLVILGFFWDYIEIPAVIVLGIWFLTQLLNLGGSGGMTHGGGVAYWAHVGGFVAGVVIILILGGRALRRPPRQYSPLSPLGGWGRRGSYEYDRRYPFRRWR
ncbi:MAG: rhomboid family intramembrane serine protease [Armatimonadetes bacterium]|nr:rhomboid family intramembrane serine protease [Armatimonadota bacterium]